MGPATKAGLASLLKGLAWLLFVSAGLTFWVGGKAINEFAKTERVLAEVESIGLSMLLAVIGAVARTAATRLEEGDESVSLSDRLRK